MNYTIVPSLKHMALVVAAARLWNQDDIRGLMAKFYFPLLGSERQERWQEIEDKVIEKNNTTSTTRILTRENIRFY